MEVTFWVEASRALLAGNPMKYWPPKNFVWLLMCALLDYFLRVCKVDH